MRKLIWPGLGFLAILFVLLIGVDNESLSMLFLLFPLGVILVLIILFHQPRSQRLAEGSRHKALNITLLSVWPPALFSIGGLHFGWFVEGWGGLIYVLPAALFTLIGITLLIIRIVER